MSTRSYIAKELPNGKYKTIYCHFDGYIDGVGVLLNDIYNTEKQVDKILALGNLSSLDVVLEPNKLKEHSFASPQKHVTVAYGRDRHEQKMEAKDLTLKDMFEDYWIEYFYIFTKDGQWTFSNAFFEKEILEKQSEEALKLLFQPLSEEVDKECTDEYRKELKHLQKTMESDEEM